MLLWLVPIVTGVGYLAFRSWQQDAALRSGELMDVREVSPDGVADLEVRALGSRRYRLELQFEASSVIHSQGLKSRGIGKMPAAFAYHLRVEALGETETGLPVYDRERDLRELMDMASSARASKPATRPERISHWGSVPLLEFESTTLGRMRFEFSVETRERGECDGAAFEAQIDKAWLILKEDVSGLRVSGGRLDFVSLDLQGLPLRAE